MLVGLKSFVISRNLRLYRLKLGKLSALAEDFLTSSHIIVLIHYSTTRLQQLCRVGFLCTVSLATMKALIGRDAASTQSPQP
jgi:hypothetical protein